MIFGICCFSRVFRAADDVPNSLIGDVHGGLHGDVHGGVHVVSAREEPASSKMSSRSQLNEHRHRTLRGRGGTPASVSETLTDDSMGSSTVRCDRKRDDTSTLS